MISGELVRKPATPSFDNFRSSYASQLNGCFEATQTSPKGTEQPVRFLRSRHSRRKLPNFVWQPASGRCTPNSGHWLQLPQCRLRGGTRHGPSTGHQAAQGTLTSLPNLTQASACQSEAAMTAPPRRGPAPGPTPLRLSAGSGATWRPRTQCRIPLSRRTIGADQ